MGERLSETLLECAMAAIHDRKHRGFSQREIAERMMRFSDAEIERMAQHHDREAAWLRNWKKG